MPRSVFHRMTDVARLMGLSLRLQLGRYAWTVPLLVLLWPAWLALSLLAGWRQQGFAPADAQNGVIGFPLVVLAIGLGVRVVASEIEQRTLEVAYTVPGGARRIWLSKLGAIMLVLAAAGALLAATTAAFFTAYPLASLYGALQGALFYLVLAAGLGALLRSEITAAMVAALVLALNGFFTGFGATQGRWSPLFNPLAVSADDTAGIFAWTLQNRIGFALLIMALIALTCARAERRERLLGD